ncbi:HD domain-containing protein [Rhodanobacter soli]|uniref:HD domain-containing protein n=1 Tax=Rhodanobacter soli TaxID=590609 RepID=UPI0031E0B5E5
MIKPYVLKIELPGKLAQLILTDSAIYGLIESAVSDFSIWLADNKTPFFFEYTDHGIAHVTNVLRSAESLIAPDAWDFLTPEDGAAIISAVLLHDCAMHLSVDGFFTLLKTAGEVESSLFFGESPWQDEYANFEQEAGRWDADKLISVFGDSEPPEMLKEFHSLSDRQKLLVGEFLRRNHARVAHQIALNGVPGSEGCTHFIPFKNFPMELRDLYGFLARSHNMSIRASVDMIPRLSRRIYMEIHAPFVMAILRIADYIQIDSARAPTQILQLRGLKSPVSRKEWAKHHAVLELHQLGDDPEALNVVADPKNVDIFCGLRSLFKDLQRELDESWALLGEVYGRVRDLSNLGLTVRRLHSNLDDVEEFERTNRPVYIPREVRLTTASAELLHLLVGPLYGNKPSVGVRELLQNSIDASLERESCSSTHHIGLGEPYVPMVELELDVSNPSSSYLRITDNGVGMTLETVESFFLRAGASFRNSKWWKSEYLDETGGSAVRRSGRFGVGALAAFLIGPVITLSTRHFLDETGRGLKFEIRLDNGLIQISRVAMEIGTSISVKITDERVSEELLKGSSREVGFADWYVYDRPIVRYRIHSEGEWKDRNPKVTIKGPLVDRESSWTSVSTKGFDGVFWSYESKISGYYSNYSYLCCNGLFVCNVEYHSSLPDINISGASSGFRVAHPSLLIDDKDGRLPLTIQRSGLAEDRYPFQDELVQSVADEYCRDIYLALSIDAVPSNIPLAIKRVGDCLKKYGAKARAQLIGLAKSGWIPLDDFLLQDRLPKEVMLELGSGDDSDWLISGINFLKHPDLLIAPFLVESSGLGVTLGFVRSIMEGSCWGYENPFKSYGERVFGMRFFIRSDANKFLLKKGSGLPQFLWRQLNSVYEDDSWCVYDVGSPPTSSSGFGELLGLAANSSVKVFCFCYFGDEILSVDDGEKLVLAEKQATNSPFGQAWLDICSSGYFEPQQD